MVLQCWRLLVLLRCLRDSFVHSGNNGPPSVGLVKLDILIKVSTFRNCVAVYLGGSVIGCLGYQECARFESKVPVGQFLPLIVGQVLQFRRDILVQNTELAPFGARCGVFEEELECRVLGVDVAGDQTGGRDPVGIQHLLGRQMLSGSKQHGPIVK